MNDMELQLDFDFSDESEDQELKTAADPQEKAELSAPSARRAVIAWLLNRNPAGIATAVPTRQVKFKADVAAFWLQSQKGKSVPSETAIVEFRHTREECWPDCANCNELLEQLIAERAKRTELETEIRRTEPELRDCDTLFEEFQSWNYNLSSSKQYHKCRKKVESIEHALYKGSKFEQLRRAHVADYHYLAVPEGLVRPEEIALDWGLLYVSDSLAVKTVKEATKRDCTQVNRTHLVMNIAASGLKDILFANGLHPLKSGDIVYTALPRRRRKREGVFKNIE